MKVQHCGDILTTYVFSCLFFSVFFFQFIFLDMFLFKTSCLLVFHFIDFGFRSLFFSFYVR